MKRFLSVVLSAVMMLSAVVLPIQADEVNEADSTAVASSVVVSLADAVVSKISDKTYTGSKINPKPTVKINGIKLTYSTDYKLSYKNNKSVGTATVTVTGCGKYTGSTSTTFKILPAAPTVSKVTLTAAGTIKVSYTKSSGATGYRIKVKTGSTSKTFKVTSQSTLSKTISSLTHGKTYTVSVRAACLGSDGKYYYSAWSDAKKITLKKYSGYTLIGGYLYYFSSGKAVTDKKINNLYFGKDGKYTTGDKSLDKTIAKKINANTTESMTKREKLRALDKYMANNYTYKAKPYVAVGATGWENKYAKDMFSNKCGNCYSFAAALTLLARGIGYSTATAVSGWVMGPGWGSYYRHGFVEIKVKGVTYICDAEEEYKYKYDFFYKPASQQYFSYKHTI